MYRTKPEPSESPLPIMKHKPEQTFVNGEM